MSTSPASQLRSSCPVAASLDVLGDRWTLVVLREPADRRHHTLRRFRRRRVDRDEHALPSGSNACETSGSSLGSGIQRMVAAGSMCRQPAIGLIPVLVDLMIWGIANTAVDVPR
ncbi:MAG: hypothetical protein R2705_13835 [Ilumatobacteraceae bacterium]